MSKRDVQAAFDKIQLSAATRHVIFCAGPDCCAMDEGLAIWKHLKSRLKELDVPALRTKAACLRICSGGPWMLVYPEGVWYGAITRERCDRIVREHVAGGRVVQEWATRVHPLLGD